MAFLRQTLWILWTFTMVIGQDNEKCSQKTLIGYRLKMSRDGDIAVGETVELRCRSGYTTYARNITATCLQGGTWSEPTATCNKKSCPNPGEIQNGKVIFHGGQDALKYGANISYVCNEGYFLVGREYVRYCMIGASGQMAWSSSPPFCEKEKCHRPKIENGDFKPDKDYYEYNDAVHFECNEGYTLVGPHSIACAVNNTWTSNMPTCELAGCKFPSVTHGYPIQGFSLTYKHKQSVTFACNDGFVLRGSPTITCNVTEWDPPLPKCVLEDIDDPNNSNPGRLHPTPNEKPNGNVFQRSNYTEPPTKPEDTHTAATCDTNCEQPPKILPTSEGFNETTTSNTITKQLEDEKTTSQPNTHITSALTSMKAKGNFTNKTNNSTDLHIASTPTSQDDATPSIPSVQTPNYNTNAPTRTLTSLHIEEGPSNSTTSEKATSSTLSHNSHKNDTGGIYTTLNKTTQLPSTNKPTNSQAKSSTKPRVETHNKTTSNPAISLTDSADVPQRPREPTLPPIFRPPASKNRYLEKQLVIGLLTAVALTCGLITLFHYLFFR
ncbi:KCP [Human gammaherpesvirus 8]|uniref:ORF4 n=1 Tax=Human herpesvirus 8 TaxID=37296 RepID=A0A5P9K4F9_HHV8|nr:KCP [Human gammaherpesvirus 8]QFU18707.1 KCP [Human gammaherpesvirus 8]QLF96491.1 ORF4 [Human gammaherpesvirus 8]